MTLVSVFDKLWFKKVQLRMDQMRTLGHVEMILDATVTKRVKHNSEVVMSQNRRSDGSEDQRWEWVR